jgi:DNA-binding NarL/FixJ family response regulator
MRLLLVDDDERFLTALEAFLADLPDTDVVGFASDGVEAVELAEELRPHVVLMDIDMPGRNGLEASRLINERLPETNIVILSGADVIAHGSAATAVGAIAYLRKSQIATELPPLLDVLRIRSPG